MQNLSTLECHKTVRSVKGSILGHSLPIPAPFFTLLHAFEPRACLLILDKHRNEGPHARNYKHTMYVNSHYIHSLPSYAPFSTFSHPFEPRVCLFVLDEHRNQGPHT